jgi:hypothetical protein
MSSLFHPQFFFFFAGYFTTRAELNAEKARLVKAIGVINCKGFERKLSCPIPGNIPVFAYSDRGNP